MKIMKMQIQHKDIIVKISLLKKGDYVATYKGGKEIRNKELSSFIAELAFLLDVTTDIRNLERLKILINTLQA